MAIIRLQYKFYRILRIFESFKQFVIQIDNHLNKLLRNLKCK